MLQNAQMGKYITHKQFKAYRELKEKEEEHRKIGFLDRYSGPVFGSAAITSALWSAYNLHSFFSVESLERDYGESFNMFFACNSGFLAFLFGSFFWKAVKTNKMQREKVRALEQEMVELREQVQSFSE